jgi:3-deoxy-7-phosphoheptulonate synthase
LITPAILLEELPMSDAMVASVAKDRAEITEIMHGRDPRLVVVVHVRFTILTLPKNTRRD